MYLDVEVDFRLAQTDLDPPPSVVCWWLTKKYGDKVVWRMGVSRNLYPDTKAGSITISSIIQPLSIFIYPPSRIYQLQLILGTKEENAIESGSVKIFDHI